jgi:AcrR family transcriptional regulator
MRAWTAHYSTACQDKDDARVILYAGVGGRMSRAALAGKREQTKAANRAAILDAARKVFADIGYGAATVRDIVRETDLATGTFYNYFPDKESVLHALLDEAASEIRSRVRAARSVSTTAEEFVEGSFRAYYGYLVEDPKTFGMLRRNAGTIRSLFDEPTVGAGVQELREDLAAGARSGLLREHDVEYMASAMVGAGFEVAVRMLERDPPDVDGAVDFVSRLFLAALSS